MFTHSVFKHSLACVQDSGLRRGACVWFVFGFVFIVFRLVFSVFGLCVVVFNAVFRFRLDWPTVFRRRPTPPGGF